MNPFLTFAGKDLSADPRAATDPRPRSLAINHDPSTGSPFDSLSPDDKAYALRALAMPENRGRSAQDIVDAINEQKQGADTEQPGIVQRGLQTITSGLQAARGAVRPAAQNLADIRIRNPETGETFRAPAGTPVPEGFEPIAEPGIMQKIGKGLGAARAFVHPAAQYAAKFLQGPNVSKDPIMKPSQDTLAELLNPVPGDLGSGVATAAGIGAAVLTGGKAGVLPALFRALAPPAGLAGGQLAEQGEVDLSSVFLTAAATMSPEAVAGVIGQYRRIKGARRLQPGDVKRVAEGVSKTSRHPVAPTAEGLALAGESKPSMGNPASSKSLEAALDREFKGVLKSAGQLAEGKGVVFALPDGEAATLTQALDTYANLRSQGATAGMAKPGMGSPRAQAEKLWSHIIGTLQKNTDPQLQLAGAALKASRTNLARGMSAYRTIQDARTGTGVGGKALAPYIDAQTGAANMDVMQQRFNALVDAGAIAPEVRDQLERAIFRGGRQAGQPPTDIPGQFKIGSWMRLGHGFAPAVGVHPEGFFRAQRPQFVGTPGNLGAIQPPAGASRNLMSLGGLATGQGLNRLKNAPTP